MSSLSATQSDGYYLPPEYFTTGAYKKKSKNQFQNSKGHNQFIQNGVVRFELPYDGFCLKCGAHVGKGTRFNAKKKFNGEKYFTSKVWEFEMKCRACADCRFLIKTNPKDRCFDYVKGIKKKVEEFDTVEAQSLGVVDTDIDATNAGNIVPYTNTSKEKHGLEAIGDCDNPIDKLQNIAQGERKALSEKENMEFLLHIQDRTMYCDADSNSFIRSKYRAKRKEREKRLLETESLGLGKGILLSSKDEVQASNFDFKKEEYKKQERTAIANEKSRLQKVRSSSIFGASTKSITFRTRETKRVKKDYSSTVDGIPSNDRCDLRRNKVKSKSKKRTIVFPLKSKTSEREEKGVDSDASVAVNLFDYCSDSD